MSECKCDIEVYETIDIFGIVDVFGGIDVVGTIDVVRTIDVSGEAAGRAGHVLAM